MPDLIDVIEMYLKAILEMQEADVAKRRVRIAQRLEQSGPTVTKTVFRMERDGLVSFSEENKKLDFTAHGFQTAIGVMRKHRLAECFLTDVVGLEWALVHDEACRWEHVMSNAAAEQMDHLLGHPSRSPYGNPIPPPEPERWNPLEDHPGVSNLMRFLHQAEPDTPATIEWIGEPLQADTRTMGKLEAAGARPGARATFTSHGSSVLLHSAERTEVVELQHQTAAELFVRA